MLTKIIVTFEHTTLLKLEPNSKPHMDYTTTEEKVVENEKQKEEFLKRVKKHEYKTCYKVSAMPYANQMVNEVTESKITNIEELPMKKVKKYFFMYCEQIGVNEYDDGFGGTACNDEISNWEKSKYFDDEESAYMASLSYNNTTPIMKGIIFVTE